MEKKITEYLLLEALFPVCFFVIIGIFLRFSLTVGH